MSPDLEEAFHQDMLELYARARDEVGYRASRYLQSVRRNGGKEAARRLLKPRKSDTSKGLDALLSANRPDLTVEFLVLRPKYAELFTETEREEAKRRLALYRQEAERRAAERT
jgi:hypothetical protein